MVQAMQWLFACPATTTASKVCSFSISSVFIPPRVEGKAQPRSRSGGQPVPTLREPYRLEIHDLEVHHRIYERLGNEVLSYLVVLCRRCHQHYHGILPEAA